MVVNSPAWWIVQICPAYWATEGHAGWGLWIILIPIFGDACLGTKEEMPTESFFQTFNDAFETGNMKMRARI